MVNLRLSETVRPWFQNSRPRLKAQKFQDNGTNNANKMTENANGSPPIYCFVLFYCLNLLADVLFNKMYPKSPENENFETHQKCLQNFEINQNFPRPMFFEVPFYTHIAVMLGLHESNNTINIIVLWAL